MGLGHQGASRAPTVSSLPYFSSCQKKEETRVECTALVAFLGPPVMVAEFLRMLLLALPHAWQGAQSAQSFLCILSPSPPACGL